jgi:hypothetical protein
MSGDEGMGVPFVMIGTGLWPAFLKVRHALRHEPGMGSAWPP